MMMVLVINEGSNKLVEVAFCDHYDTSSLTFVSFFYFLSFLISRLINYY